MQHRPDLDRSAEARKSRQCGRTLHPHRYARLRQAPNKPFRDCLIVSANTDIITIDTIVGNRAVALLVAELDR